ncbi:MAG: rhamnogalacturonan acetylesterase [Opitutaceae bacterium]|nr:rhamnogalacturonan acetylesterase [Opitutaceae bacterium]
MKHLPILLLLLAVVVTSAGAAAPHVYLVGDSTMSDMPATNPRRGWGMLFRPLFTNPENVLNLAVNGESTRSCVESGHWKEIVARLVPGDFVLIQYGHNDEVKEKAERYTEPAAFAEYLRRFVSEVRARGANPLLATPVCRRKFDAAGRIVPTHGPYPELTRTVAKEESVPLLDLERATTLWLESTGEEGSRDFFMGRRNPRLPPGKEDIEHFVEAGAAKVAVLAANEIRAQKLPLAALLK